LHTLNVAGLADCAGIQLWHSQVRVTAHLHDTFIQVPRAAVAIAYRDVHSLSEQNGLTMQPTMSTVNSPASANANATSQSEEFGFEVNHRDIVAAGCPFGDPGFVAEQAMRSAW
jgi:hypothetical protein